MKKILITGSGGFIGVNLTRALEGKYHLTCLDLQANQSIKQTDFYTWDELDKLSRYDVIIHLAGKAHDTGNTSGSQAYYDVNFGLTKRIFDFFILSGSSKFVFFSSVKAVVDKLNCSILTEDHIPNPQTPYGNSKLIAEKYILDQPLSDNKRVYILRPCMIHGPGNKGNLNLLYTIVKKGIPYPLGDFHNLRSLTSIGNLLFTIREIIDKDIDQGIYQVADDEPISTNEIVKLMARSLNKNIHLWKVPKGIIKSVAIIGDLTHLPFNSERLQKLTESFVVSNRKLKSALGIINMPVNAIEGLKLTFDSF